MFTDHRPPHLERSLLKILAQAISVGRATKGNLQLNQNGALKIVAHLGGYNGDFLSTFQVVRSDEPSVCGRAFREKMRVAISDIRKDALFAPYLPLAAANDFRAVQSTPILAADGSVAGVFSTHFPDAEALTSDGHDALNQCAKEMAKLLGVMR